MGDNRSAVAMFLFCWFTLNNGFSWLMFAPVTQKVIRFYRPWVDEHQLELLNSWQPFIYLLAFFPVMKLLSTRDGLKKAMKFGVACELVGALFKATSTFVQHEHFCLVLLNVGQICSALASPVAIGAPSALSAAWYDADERTRATAAAVLFNNVGNALSYTLVPNMTKALGFESVIYFEFLMALLVVVLTYTMFPSVPDSIQLDTQPSQPLREQLRDLALNPSVVMLFIVYSWSSGAYVAWQSMFDEMYDPFFGSVFIGHISFVGTIGYVMGGMVASYLTDLYFRRQMKFVIVICCAMNVVACIGFLMMMPGSAVVVTHGHHHTITNPDGIEWNWGRGWILGMAMLCGFFNGGAAPIFYELVAEITYPVEEGVSGNVMSMCENVGSLFVYQIIARVISVKGMNSVFTGGMAAVTVLGLFVKQTYKRMDVFEEERDKIERGELTEKSKLMSRSGDRLSMDDIDVYDLDHSMFETPTKGGETRHSLHGSFRGSFVGTRGSFGPPPRRPSFGPGPNPSLNRGLPSTGDVEGEHHESTMKHFGYGAA